MIQWSITAAVLSRREAELKSIKPKMTICTLAAVLLIAAVAVGCTFTGAKGEKPPDAEQTLYDCDGLTVAIPNEYTERLYVSDAPQKYELIRVYEQQSYEESFADWGSHAGFLFSVLRYTPAQHEWYLASDGSGLSFFAKDDTYYYGHGFATDVQFYRSSIDRYSEAAFAPWTELTDAVDGILDDFVARNGLTAYSDDEFWRREFTYDSEHLYVAYYPYYAIDGSKDVKYTLVLSQPAAQGDGGVWCVERFYDSNGTTMYYFPSWGGQTDLSAADYYAQQQAECDTGRRPGLLDPLQVAMEFALSYFSHTRTLDSFELLKTPSDSEDTDITSCASLKSSRSIT